MKCRITTINHRVSNQILIFLRLKIIKIILNLGKILSLSLYKENECKQEEAVILLSLSSSFTNQVLKTNKFILIKLIFQ